MRALRLVGLLVAWLPGVAWATPTFPLDALAPGQQGYALTAGPGNVLERFTIEVLALQHDVGLGFPLVLVRAGGPFIEASGGVAAGMSGSPVYLPYQGRDALLGAIGYIFPNSDTRIALVTPSDVMLGRTAQLGGNSFGERYYQALREAHGPPVPVATPLLLSGASARASPYLSPLFADRRVTPFPVQTGHVSGAQDDAFTLQPGSAVSVQLVRGDVTIAAIGTVTLIEGSTLYAFGHPLLGQGEVSYALAPAHVTYIVSSPVVPFKLADSGQRILGTISQDRPQAISGTVGAQPDFIPVTLTLNGPRGSATKRLEITADERFYAPLLAAATVQLLDEALQQLSGGTAELTWEIGLAGGDTLRVLEQTTHPSDIAAVSAGLAAAPLAILAENVFADPAVERVDLAITLSQAQRYAELVEVVAEDEEVAPGSFVRVHLRLQPYRDEPLVRTLTIPLPRDLSPGPIELIFRGGLTPDEGEGEPILSFSELLISLREQVQARELVVETYVNGERQQLMRQSFDFLLQGSQTLTLTVTNGEPTEEPNATESDSDEQPSDPLPSLEPGAR